MQITIKNEINLDGEIELIEMVYPLEVTEKNNQIYLIYINDEEEKVVIKANEEELVMTRFSTPKSHMRFIAEKEIIITIPTALGIQHFVTDTKFYTLNREQGEITLNYALKQLGSEQVFAYYHMTMVWE